MIEKGERANGEEPLALNAPQRCTKMVEFGHQTCGRGPYSRDHHMASDVSLIDVFAWPMKHTSWRWKEVRLAPEASALSRDFSSLVDIADFWLIDFREKRTVSSVPTFVPLMAIHSTQTQLQKTFFITSNLQIFVFLANIALCANLETYSSLKPGTLRACSSLMLEYACTRPSLVLTLK